MIMMAPKTQRGVKMLLTLYTFFLLSMGLYGYFFGGSSASLIASSVSIFLIGLFHGIRKVSHGAVAEFASIALITVLCALLLYFGSKLFTQFKVFPTLLLTIATVAVLASELYIRFNAPKQERNYAELSECDESQFLDS